jgi:cyanophycinase
MITGGESYQGLNQGTKIIWNPYDTLKNPNTLTAYGYGGVGLFPYGILDTHFANRGRQGRLIELLFDSHELPTSNINAFCIDENTALIVTGKWNNRIGTVIG